MGNPFLAVIDEWAIVGLMFEFAPHRRQMVMHKLAGADSMVAVIAEVFHYSLGILEHRILEPLVPEQILRGMWIDSSEKAGARWCTDGIASFVRVAC